MSFMFPSNGFPLFKLFVYVKVPGYVVMYWHSSDLCAKLTFETETVQPPRWPCVQCKHLFPVPLPLHSWMALIQTVLTQNLDPALTYRQIVEITSKKKGRHSEMSRATNKWYVKFHNYVLLASNWLTLFVFPENQTSEQTVETSGK